jgi:RNA polymerase primary sigma factor
MNREEQQSQLKELIAKGKEQGYLTYTEVNDHLPDSIIDSEQIEDIIAMINDMGIAVHEQAPDADTLLLSDGSVSSDDDAEDAVAALAAVDSDFGRTTDPVRMYMREMGTVELLTREGEIRIAKRIEEGLMQVLFALAHHPTAISQLLEQYERLVANNSRLTDLIVSFINPDIADGEAVARGLAEPAEIAETPAAAAAPADTSTPATTAMTAMTIRTMTRRSRTPVRIPRRRACALPGSPNCTAWRRKPASGRTTRRTPRHARKPRATSWSSSSCPAWSTS